MAGTDETRRLPRISVAGRTDRDIRPSIAGAIIDLSLPRLDGWELIRVLQAEPATAAFPILVLTGLGVEHAERSVALGANDFLTKPLSGTVLLNTVRALLDRGANR